jgi:hypothetical protein
VRPSAPLTSLRRPPWLAGSSLSAIKLEVANCDFKLLSSSRVNSKMKSCGNRFRLRRTCSLSRRVSTPYSEVKSASSNTFCSRSTKMRCVMVSSAMLGAGAESALATVFAVGAPLMRPPLLPTWQQAGRTGSPVVRCDWRSVRLVKTLFSAYLMTRISLLEITW